MEMRKTLVATLMNGSAGLYPAIRKSNGTKRTRRTNPRPPIRRTTKVKGRPARLVKGSKAAKAYMAKIRRKRRR